MSQIVWRPEVVYNKQCCAMVLCVVLGSSKLSERNEDVSLYRIPKKIISRREDTKMLSEKQRNGFVAASSKCDISYHKEFSLRQNKLSMPLVWNPFSTIVFSVYLVY